MRKLVAPLVFGSALALGACATSPYGSYGSPYGAYGGMGGPLETILGSIAGSPYYGANFQQAAINACAGVASRYGQVAIRDIDRVGSSTLRVYGIVRGYRSDDFACSFRSDGRITDFDI